MNVAEPTHPHDPAQLAESVRELAASAHSLLNDPAARPRDVTVLLRRIAQLQERVADDPGAASLRSWLASLRRQVKSRCAPVLVAL